MRFIDEIPSSLSQSRLMERQCWRLHDIHGGSFGFTLELYFLSVGKFLSTFPSYLQPELIRHIVLTFKKITSHWRAFVYYRGTRQVILNIVLDIAFYDRGIFSNVRYPDYITNELLNLFRWTLDGQEDAYIEDARREIYHGNLTPNTLVDQKFLVEVKNILGPLRVSPPAPAPHE